MDPMAPWRAFGPLRRQLRGAAPNAAHLALADLEARLVRRTSVTIITQNVDGLHQQAGSQNVLELHGSVRRTRCSDAECPSRPFEDDRDYDVAPVVPRCEVCGGFLRPDVVLRGEPIPPEIDWATKRALRGCDLFIAVGTPGGTVSPASSLVRSARYEGARTVYINLTPLDPPNPAFEDQLLGVAEELLPRYLAPRRVAGVR